MGNAMITTVKAFSLGLTSMLVMRGFNNDPHGMFANGDAQATTTAIAMGKMLNGIHDLAKAQQDPSCSAKTLADSIVLLGQRRHVQGALQAQRLGRRHAERLEPALRHGRRSPQVRLVRRHRPDDRRRGLGSDDRCRPPARTPAAARSSGPRPRRRCSTPSRRATRAASRDFYNGKAIDGVVNLNVTG